MQSLSPFLIKLSHRLCFILARLGHMPKNEVLTIFLISFHHLQKALTSSMTSIKDDFRTLSSTSSLSAGCNAYYRNFKTAIIAPIYLCKGLP